MRYKRETKQNRKTMECTFMPEKNVMCTGKKNKQEIIHICKHNYMILELTV